MTIHIGNFVYSSLRPKTVTVCSNESGSADSLRDQAIVTFGVMRPNGSSASLPAVDSTSSIVSVVNTLELQGKSIDL